MGGGGQGERGEEENRHKDTELNVIEKRTDFDPDQFIPEAVGFCIVTETWVVCICSLLMVININNESC